jgi:peptidoglycan/LPS O-acetylase OafA/YrhL
MSRGRVRALLVALFGAAAILSAIGNTSGRRWLTALAFICFAAGAAVLLHWRRKIRGRVLDREEKTDE